MNGYTIINMATKLRDLIIKSVGMVIEHGTYASVDYSYIFGRYPCKVVIEAFSKMTEIPKFKYDGVNDKLRLKEYTKSVKKYGPISKYLYYATVSFINSGETNIPYSLLFVLMKCQECYHRSISREMDYYIKPMHCCFRVEDITNMELYLKDVQNKLSCLIYNGLVEDIMPGKPYKYYSTLSYTSSRFYDSVILYNFRGEDDQHDYLDDLTELRDDLSDCIGNHINTYTLNNLSSEETQFKLTLDSSDDEVKNVGC